jgi:5'-nucleotidase
MFSLHSTKIRAFHCLDLLAPDPHRRYHSYTWSASAAAGSRVSDIMLNGETVDPAGVYRVTVNSFLADGGDNFTILREGTNRYIGIMDIDALVAYFGANSPVAPGPQDRITRVD